MARRSDHTRAELEQLALDAGWEMLVREGLEAFSARKLAASIGYSVGTITHLFGSYDALILRLNAQTLDTWYEALELGLKRYRGKEPLTQLARDYLTFSRTHPHAWMALFTHQLTEGEVLPAWYIAKLQRFFILTESLLLPLLGSQKRRAPQTARLLWAGIHGIAMLGLSGKLDIVGNVTAEALAIDLVKTYIKGMHTA